MTFFREHPELLKNVDIDADVADKILDLYCQGGRMTEIASMLDLPREVVFIVIKKAVLHDYTHGMSLVKLRQKYQHAYSTLYDNFIRGGIKYKLWRQIYQRGNVRLIHIPSKLIPESFTPKKARWRRIESDVFEVTLYEEHEITGKEENLFSVNVGVSNKFRVIFLYVPVLVGRDKKERRILENDCPMFLIEFR